MDEIPTNPFIEGQQYPYFQIPIDLFVCKKYKRLGSRGYLTFTDSAGNLVYRVQNFSHKSDFAAAAAADGSDRGSVKVKLLLDSSGNTLFSMYRVTKGSWQGFRGTDHDQKDLVFTADRTLDEFTRTDFKIILVDEGSNSELQMKGCPLKRACTIYKGDSIVAETSLMYKIGVGKMFVPRSRFRVTMFPGSTDHSLVASLIVIYFDRRKLWI